MTDEIDGPPRREASKVGPVSSGCRGRSAAPLARSEFGVSFEQGVQAILQRPGLFARAVVIRVLPEDFEFGEQAIALLDIRGFGQNPWRAAELGAKCNLAAIEPA